MAEPKPMTTSNELELYRDLHEAFEKDLQGGSGPPRIQRLRGEALEAFLSMGFPTRKVEEWKYTDVTPIARGAFRPAAHRGGAEVSRESLERHWIPGIDGARLVFVNGAYAEHLSEVRDLPEGVTLGSLGEALASGAAGIAEELGTHAPWSDDPFTALSTAFLRDGAYLHVPEGVAVETPIQLLFLGSPEEGGATMANPRNFYALGRGSHASVIETYAGPDDGTYFTNSVSEATLEPDAALNHCRVLREGRSAYHVTTVQAYQRERSRFRNYSVTLGGAIVRNNIRTNMDAEESIARLDGVYYAHDRQVVDNYTSVDHAKPNCNSFELYKGIIDDQASGVFNGRIYVHQDAQKTDAKQSNAGLLLSEDAKINSKPQLEIFADDVKCTHGATVGFLDRDALFYLRSRGFGEEQARHMLVYAFANEVLERIPLEPVREALGASLLEALSEGRRKEV